MVGGGGWSVWWILEECGKEEGEGRTDKTGTKGFGIIDVSGVPEAGSRDGGVCVVVEELELVFVGMSCWYSVLAFVTAVGMYQDSLPKKTAAMVAGEKRTTMD